MTAESSRPEPSSSEASRPEGPGHQRGRRLRIGVITFRVIFLLGLARMFAPFLTEDLAGEAWLPPATWEWTLCALSPVVLIYLARRPDDWSEIADERSLIKWALVIYLFYASLLAVGKGYLSLWMAVAVSLSGLAGMAYLNRKEQVGED
ncbi:hypothetical protein [Streptomyces sp. NPDC020607]|uniref:hypothetical protein n=1 Tax=Streptomyces sp. NPDC020607 TaxID=3365082 RepID=UPI003794E428